jgi:hypothetical protein
MSTRAWRPLLSSVNPKDKLSRKKQRPATRNAKGKQPVPQPAPSRDMNVKGPGKCNRVDTRVKELNDLKRRGFPSSARLIDKGDMLFIEQHNDKIVNGMRRKVKCRTPSRADNLSSQNLGRIMKDRPLVHLRNKGPLSGYIARMLQRKTDNSFRVLTRVQDLLIGTVLESKFYYHACAPYLKACAGKLLISRKPSLGSSRLILTQLLRVKSNFPWGRLESIIR